MTKQMLIVRTALCLSCLAWSGACARNADRLVPTLDSGAAFDAQTSNDAADVVIRIDTSDPTPDAVVGSDTTVVQDTMIGRDIASDADVLCTSTCPESCTSPLICAADGTEWCTECEMNCAGRSPAPDIVYCTECAPDSDWTPVPSRNLQIPDDCTSDVAFAITVDSAEFLNQLFVCAEGPIAERVDFDFTDGGLYLWIGFQNPDARVVGVFDDGSNYQVYVTAPAFCSGIAPPLTHRLVVYQPSNARVSVLSRYCEYGSCGDPPPP
jgi:hypothetical protein